MWLIPAENAKNGRAHEIHLSGFARQQLKLLEGFSESDYVLAGRNPGEPIDEKTLSKAIRDRTRAAPLKKRTPH